MASNRHATGSTCPFPRTSQARGWSFMPSYAHSALEPRGCLLQHVFPCSTGRSKSVGLGRVGPRLECRPSRTERETERHRDQEAREQEGTEGEEPSAKSRAHNAKCQGELAGGHPGGTRQLVAIWSSGQFVEKSSGRNAGDKDKQTGRHETWRKGDMLRGASGLAVRPEISWELAGGQGDRPRRRPGSRRRGTRKRRGKPRGSGARRPLWS